MNNKNLQANGSISQRSSSRWVLYLLILLSGAAGLVYEVVWARQLTLFIGGLAPPRNEEDAGFAMQEVNKLIQCVG